jgi:hypothetical protein
MRAIDFAAELDLNRAAYQRHREKIRAARPGHYAAIAQGELIAVACSFEDAVMAIERLQPPPEHFLVFPVDEEPAWDVIDDFFRSL